MKNGRARLTTCLTLVILSTVWLYAGSVAQQSRERNLRRLRHERDEPLFITKVMVKGRDVFLSQKFLSDEDWLDGLTISVRNTSNKAILFASIDIQFPRAKGDTGRITIDDLSYGNRALCGRQPRDGERTTGIRPGQSVDLKLTTHEYLLVRQNLAENGYSSEIETVDLKIGRVIFEDDSMWYLGNRLQRDQNDPRTWRNIEPTSPDTARAKVPTHLRSLPVYPAGVFWEIARWEGNKALSPRFELSMMDSLFLGANYAPPRPSPSPIACNAFDHETFPRCWPDGVWDDCARFEDFLKTTPGNYFFGYC